MTDPLPNPTRPCRRCGKRCWPLPSGAMPTHKALDSRDYCPGESRAIVVSGEHVDLPESSPQGRFYRERIASLESALASATAENGRMRYELQKIRSYGFDPDGEPVSVLARGDWCDILASIDAALAGEGG